MATLSCHVMFDIFFSAVLFLTIDSAMICPSTLPCSCFEVGNAFMVNCSFRSLQDIPKEIPPETTSLILSSNNISILRNYSFMNLNNLSYLDIGNNYVSVIQEEAFQGLANLETLLLNSNKLNAKNNKAYPKEVFKPLGTLKVLDIRNNVQCLEDGQYPAASVSVISSLQELRLDVIQQKPLPVEFSNLTQLQTIHFQPEHGYCCFYNLSRQTLAALQGLPVETLVYRECVLTHVFIDVFKSHLALRSLLFEGTSVYSVAEYLATAVMNSGITKLHLNDTGINDKIWNFIKGLETSNVTSLMFDNDMIYNDYQEPVYFKDHLPGLEELSLGDNYLSWTTDLTYDFLTAPNLRYLNLSWQQREHVTSPEPTHKESNKVNLQPYEKHVPLHNMAEAHPSEYNTVVFDKRLRTLESADVKIHGDHSDSSDNKFLPKEENNQPRSTKAENQQTGKTHGLGIHLCGVGVICPIPIPKHLEIIDMSHNGLHLPQVPDLLMMNKNNFKTLICSHNRITMLPNKILCWHNFSMVMETLDLSHNQINHVVHDLFGRCDFTSMKNFLFSGNLFGQICTSSQPSCHFLNAMPKIETLDFSTNEIHKLPSTFLSHHNQMRLLDLSNNSMQDINFNVSHMQNLKLLDLSLNKFTCLNAEVHFALSKIPNATIRLVGNKLSCTCSCLHFIQWVFLNQHRLVDLDDTKCTLKNGTQLTLEEIAHIRKHLEASCIDMAWIWASALCLLTSCSLITVVTVVIRYKWELRYSLYRISLRMGHFQICEPDGPFRYDAFLAFHESDINWVCFSAISALEQKAGLSLCIHKRDFLPGNAIVDNICEAFNNSKKIVIVLTNEFLKSGWCQFEFKLAHSMSIDRGRNLLIFVILKKIHKKKIPDNIMQILNAYTYLEWPDDPVREGLFWTRLEEAIRDQSPSVVNG